MRLAVFVVIVPVLLAGCEKTREEEIILHEAARVGGHLGGTPWISLGAELLVDPEFLKLMGSLLGAIGYSVTNPRAVYEEFAAEEIGLIEPFRAGLEAWRAGDMTKAVKAWTVSARGGNLAAMNNLGVLYATGVGIRQNAETAGRLWAVAEKHGLKVAGRNLDRLARTRFPGREKFIVVGG